MSESHGQHPHQPAPGHPQRPQPPHPPAQHPPGMYPQRPAAAPPPTTGPGGLAKIAGVPTIPVSKTVDDSPIDLVDDVPETTGQAPASKIKAFGVQGLVSHEHKWKRTPTANGTGAIRVRSFHGRLSDEGLAYMDEKINEWLDAHPEIEIKHTTATIGQYEGKIREPALVVNVWY